jgi:hypothetical protein
MDIDMETIDFTPHTVPDIPRVTGQLIVAGPKTFRRASKQVLKKRSKKAPFGNWGRNMQNWEKKTKKMLVADDGYLLVNRDQSGADAKIVAFLCKHGPYRELFLNNIKPHTYIALHRFANAWRVKYDFNKVNTALVTPIPQLQSLPFWKELSAFIKSSDDWPGNERYYYFGKKIAHASNYGMGGERLAMIVMQETQGEVVLSQREADRWIDETHASFPEIQFVFQHRVAMSAKMRGCLRNLFGFPFNITFNTEKLSRIQLNELYSWIPQSTVANLNAHAYILMQDYIEEHGKDWHILMDTHDSLTLEAPEGEALDCGKVLKDCYESYEFTSPVDGVKFHMATECQIGKNAAPFDPVKNPDGLKEVKI